MNCQDWWLADETIERLRLALVRECDADPKAVTWSYGGVSGERSTVRVSVHLSVDQADTVARLLTERSCQPSR